MKSLSSSSFQKIRSHFSFALPQCKQTCSSPVLLPSEEELTFRGGGGKGVGGDGAPEQRAPPHRGHCQRPAPFSPVGSPQVAGFNLQMRKPRLGEGVPFPGATGSQHTAVNRGTDPRCARRPRHGLSHLLCLPAFKHPSRVCGRGL